MKNTLSLLRASAATVALSALVAPGAMAFDDLNWTWNKTIDELVTKNIIVESVINPTGMAEVEKIQVQIGDVNATSEVSNITNNQPINGGGAGVISVVEEFSFAGTYGPDIDPEDINAPIIGVDDGDDDLTLTVTEGTISEGTNSFEFNILVEGELPFEAGEIAPLDAETELPTIESIATAVGNNQNLESAVSVQLHEAQLLFDVEGGGGGGGVEGLVGGAGEVLGSFGNAFHQVGLAAALGAAVGVIEKADVTALSTVDSITNARVDSSATAVGNNLSVDMASAVGGDALLIADLTQVSVADVTATSLVTDVSFTNYANLGAESVNPIVSSVATAVGNNVSINVGVPSLE